MNASPALAALSESDILSYLEAHPQFLREHPEILGTLVPPEATLGDGVLDFQVHMVDRLQESLRSVRERYEGLIVASRDNMSTQMQVHEAVLGLVRATNLEGLLQMITQDLVRLFDVDVVRLAMESPVAEYYDAQYGEHNYSGVSFIDPGTADAVLGPKADIRLIGDVKRQHDEGLSQIFADCAGLIHSCALLRMEMPSDKRQVILAFGVRHAGRFDEKQGSELLDFLARIVEHRLDQCLNREGLEGL